MYSLCLIAIKTIKTGLVSKKWRLIPNFATLASERLRNIYWPCDDLDGL